MRSQIRTAFPAAAYSTVPEGLRAIWFIWYSPWAKVMVRVVVPAHASPATTCPEELEREEPHTPQVVYRVEGGGGHRNKNPGLVWCLSVCLSVCLSDCLSVCVRAFGVILLSREG